MRSLASIAGILVLLAHLACASLCAAPQAPVPPCHSQHDDDGGSVKPCDQVSWAGESDRFVIAPVLVAGPEAVTVAALPVLSAVNVRAFAPSPPPILRV